MQIKLVEWFRLPNYSKIQYTYDHLERISGMTVMSNSENFTYAGSTYEYSAGNGSNTTSDTVEKLTLRMTNTQFSYVYDDCNNITEIYKNNSLIRKYSYDDLQQMTKEVIIEPGATTGTQYDYVYDLHGNILSKTESTYTVATGATSGSTTTQYTYGDNTWGDLLTSHGNLTFAYDEIGNLVSRHIEGNSSVYYFNWGKGRQLESLSYGTSAESATTVVAHEYNSDGVRISRTFNAGGLEYIVDGDRILKQVGCGIGVLQTLEFYYDAQGEIIGFNYGGNDYYYGKNVQGDVVELYDRWSLIATYEYDAWGNLLRIKDANGNNIPDDINSTNVAVVNPIRYRGYYYDIEKGMYYLNSRYYWPKLGRFINADGYVSTGQDILGTNMFAYCLNNPVNMIDKTGTCPHDCKFYSSGPFEGQFMYNPDCWKCEAHGDFELIDRNGEIHNLAKHTRYDFSQMAICTDGAEATYGSGSHQNETSYQISGVSMDPSIVHYVVAPVGYTGVKNGDLALVIDSATGNNLFAIVGDRGPAGQHNEVSLLVAWDLGYTWADGTRGPNSNFTVLYFPGTGNEWNSVGQLIDYLN